MQRGSPLLVPFVAVVGDAEAVISFPDERSASTPAAASRATIAPAMIQPTSVRCRPVRRIGEACSSTCASRKRRRLPHSLSDAAVALALAEVDVLRLVEEAAVPAESGAREGDAERMPADVVRDEPNWIDAFRIERIELGRESLN